MIRIVGHHVLVGDSVSFSLKDVLGDKAPRRLDRLSEMATYVAALACRRLPSFAPERAAVFFCTEYGNFAGTTAFLARLRDKGARLANPLEFPNLVLSAPTGNLSQVFGFKGELLGFNDAGLHALWAAYDCLMQDRADIALVVSAEEQSEGRRQCTGQLTEGAAALLLDRRANTGPMLHMRPAGGTDATTDVSALVALAQAVATGGYVSDGQLKAVIER